MMRYLLLVPLLVFTACSDVDEIPLQGERISILPQEKKLEQGYYGGDVILPVAYNNTNWPQAHGAQNNAVGHVSLPSQVRRAWSAKIGAGSTDTEKISQAPVIKNGVLYSMDSESRVSAFNAQTGKRLWVHKIKEEEEAHLLASGGLAVEEDKLFVTTGLGKVFALNSKTGAQIWQQSIGVPVRVAPTVAGGKVYVIGHNNRLFVLNGADGQLLWTHSGIEEGLALLGGGAATLAGDKVVVPYSSGEVYVLRDDGRYLWHEALSFNVQADPLSALVDVAASPVVVDGVIYVVNSSGAMTAFNLEKGNRLWERRLAALQTPAVAGNALFVVNTDGQMVALNRGTGKIIWVREMSTSLPKAKETRLWAGPVLAGGRLFTVSNDGYAVTIHPQNGKLLKAVKIGGGMTIAPVVANGMVYFLTEDARIVAFK